MISVVDTECQNGFPIEIISATIDIRQKHEEDTDMQSNAKTGGILSIVAGALGGIASLMGILFMILIFSITATDSSYYYDGYRYAEGSFAVFMVIWIIFAAFFVLVGALGVVGGIFAIRRKNWGLALAGAIAGTITFFPVGVPAIIFVALGKGEFEAVSPAAPQVQ
jgi:hypothetical protein